MRSLIGWFAKGAVALVALVVVITVVGALTGGGDEPAQQVATPEPSEAEAEPRVEAVSQSAPPAFRWTQQTMPASCERLLTTLSERSDDAIGPLQQVVALGNEIPSMQTVVGAMITADFAGSLDSVLDAMLSLASSQVELMETLRDLARQCLADTPTS